VLGYVAVIGEFVHAGMPWHVRMGAEGHPGGPAEALDEPVVGVSRRSLRKARISS
jgi:hypothetical protein